MKIMLLGANGVIGQAVEQVLLFQGHSYISVARTLNGPNAVIADRTDPEAIRALIEAHNVHTVIDVIAYTERDTLPLLRAIDGRIRHYVMLSSADVYRNYGLFHRTEKGIAAPQLTEASALRKRLYPYRGSILRQSDAPDQWMDDYDKIPLEKAAQKMSSVSTILRLPMVYGGRGKLARFDWLTKPILADKASIRVARNWRDWISSYGYIDNISSAIIHAATTPSVAGKVFNLTDGPAISHGEWMDAFKAVSGWAGTFEVDEENKSLKDSPLDWSIPLEVSGAAFEDISGFRPPLARNDCLRAILDELKDTPP
ncbi:MAG: sugar nucleotide-binding protein [Pseudomonadota bacterium]